MGNRIDRGDFRGVPPPPPSSSPASDSRGIPDFPRHPQPQAVQEVRLSPSQKAYQEDPQGFRQRLTERANCLFENGYGAHPTDIPHEFAVVYTDRRNNVHEYRVHCLERTCTCPFYTRQVGGEYLTDDQSLVPCKHQTGLALLIKQTCRWLCQNDRLTDCCLLWVHWMKTRAHLRRIRIAHEKHNLALEKQAQYEAQQAHQAQAIRVVQERK